MLLLTRRRWCYNSDNYFLHQSTGPPPAPGCDDVLLAKGTYGVRMCIECDLGLEEDVKHIVMQCPMYEDSRKILFQTINELPNDIGSLVLDEPGEVLYILLGKSDQRLDIEQMIQVWLISASFISRMYRTAIKKRRQLDLNVK